MARTQDQRKAETRAGLLGAAADLFARKGFHAVSAEAVADAADRTTGALYSHFGNKEGLLLALVEEWKIATADAIVARAPDPADLDAIITATWDQLTNEAADPTGEAAEVHWLLLEMELWLHGARDAQVGAQLVERYAQIRAELAKALVDFSAAADHALPAPPDQLAAMAISVLLGAALQHRLDAAAVAPPWVLATVRALVGLADSSSPRSTP